MKKLKFRTRHEYDAIDFCDVSHLGEFDAVVLRLHFLNLRHWYCSHETDDTPAQDRGHHDLPCQFLH